MKKSQTMAGTFKLQHLDLSREMLPKSPTRRSEFGESGGGSNGTLKFGLLPDGLPSGSIPPSLSNMSANLKDLWRLLAH